MTTDFAQWPLVARGSYFEDHEVGVEFRHHWGRTLHASDNLLFSTQNLAFNPHYFNADSARGAGHRSEVVNPMLVFAVAFGLSVEDLSEAGGPFLGATEVRYHRDVYPGETLYASSRVLSAVESQSRPDVGIVTWHTTGATADGDVVVDFERTNLVRKRPELGTIRQAPGGYLEDFCVGDRFRHARTRTVTDLDLNGLCLLVMNSAPGHFSDAAMADTPFGERINFGGLTLALTIGLATQDTTAHVIRELGMTDIRFPQPVRRGDTIAAATEVLSSDRDAGSVTFRHFGVNQHNAVVCEVTRTISVAARPDSHR